MIVQSKELPNELDCDLCIVGAGAAGITIAHQLRDLGIKIIVLESGLEGLDPRAQSLNVGRNIGLEYRPLDDVRLRMLGGSTNHWEGSCNDFDEIDFEERPWVKHGGWPFRKAELLPYYRSAQGYVQIGPYDYELQSWSERLAIPYPQLAGGLVGNITQHSPPTLFGDVYGDDLRRSINVTVALGATALRLKWNEEKSLANGLEVGRFSEKAISLRARRFVLAMGGIENSRFLLLNNPPNLSGMIGRYFMEHPYLRPMILAPTIRFNQFLNAWRSAALNGVRVDPSFQFSEAIVRKMEFQNCRLAFEPVDNFDSSIGIESLHEVEDGDLRSPDELFFHVGNMLLDLDLLAEGVSRSLFDKRFVPRSSNSAGYVLGCMTEQLPNPDSRVTLTNELDLFGQRKAALDLRLTDQDKISVGRFVSLLSTAFGQSGLGRIRTIIPDRFAHWPPRKISYGSHLMGTTRMSIDPRLGVVDDNLRLHGTRNIFVAGSSVFPTGSHVPPTLTIVAMAARLSNHLKSQPLGDAS